MRPRRRETILVPRKRAIDVALAEAGLTKTRLAYELGRARSHVTDVCNGKRTSESLAKRIADHLGRPLEDLFVEVDPDNLGEATAA